MEKFYYGILVLVMSVLLIAVFNSGGCRPAVSPVEEPVVEEPVVEEATGEPEEEIQEEELEEENPIAVEYEGLWEDEDIENYFYDVIFPIVEKTIDIEFTYIDSWFGWLEIHYETQKTNEEDIRKEMWEVTKMISPFQPGEHALRLMSFTKDDKIWCSIPNIPDMEKIANSEFDYEDWIIFEIEEEPIEEAEPEPEPEPIILSGSGDSIVDIDKPNLPMVVHVTGNVGSNHFAVKNYDSVGERIDLLVNTTEPYDGIIPLDFMTDEWTSRFEVTATGDWTIEVLPLSSIRVLSIPGKIEGNGDEVFVLTGGVPDLGIISGNSGSNHFAVKSYNGGRDLLVNTTDPYEGTVMVDSGTILIEVIAVGSWTIEITSK